MMAAKRTWKQSKDPLFRGDDKSEVSVPSPKANASIVRHVLFLEGPGRESPYLSTSEIRECAEHWAKGGAIWKTHVKISEKNGVNHISKSELLQAMKGNGKGKAKWDDPFEVMQARRYVEQWSEHLLDFRNVTDPEPIVKSIFEKF